jgi:hypothetical protein
MSGMSCVRLGGTMRGSRRRVLAVHAATRACAQQWKLEQQCAGEQRCQAVDERSATHWLDTYPKTAEL